MLCRPETNPLDHTFQVFLSAYFSATTVRCWCADVGLGFVLLEQIHNSHLK